MKTSFLAQFSKGLVRKPGDWLARPHNKICWWYFISAKNYLLLCAQLDDGRFIKALLSASFNPLTPKHFLGLKLETFLGTLEPTCLNGRHPCHLLSKFINVYWKENYIVQSTPTNLFMTVRMYQVPWFPLTLRVEYIALVNNSP